MIVGHATLHSALSVGRSVCWLVPQHLWILSGFPLLLLPNHPRLDCRVSSLVWHVLRGKRGGKKNCLWLFKLRKKTEANRFLFACHATTSRFVGWSVRLFVTLYFFWFLRSLASFLLPKWSSDLKYSPYPPARDWGSVRGNGSVWATSLDSERLTKQPKQVNQSTETSNTGLGEWRTILHETVYELVRWTTKKERKIEGETDRCDKKTLTERQPDKKTNWLNRKTDKTEKLTERQTGS